MRSFTNRRVIISGLLSCLAEAGLLLAGAKYLAAIIPVAVLVLYTIQAFYLRTSRQMRRLDLQAKAPLYTHILEMVDGLTTIRAFGWQSAFRTSALQRLDESQKPYYVLFCIQRWLALVLDLFVAASAVLLVAFGVLTPASTSASAIAISLYAVVNFNESLARLISSWTELETSLGAIARLRTFEKETPSEKDSDLLQNMPAQWPSQGEIQLRNLTASYSHNSIPALTNISATIRPGQKVAICGRTGSGKSSLILALFRLIDRDLGSICIDGVDITHVPHEHLRHQLVAVPQEPVLFPGTLRSNLTPAQQGGFPGEEAATQGFDERRLLEILTNISLWPTISLYGGLDTDISNFTLSHGQKQLLSIARAIVHKNASKILILDEAMSSVDQETEGTILSVLETEFASHTIVSVVHRLRTIRQYDIVIVLDKGQIVENGPPEQLLAMEKGHLRSLWNAEG